MQAKFPGSRASNMCGFAKLDPAEFVFADANAIVLHFNDYLWLFYANLNNNETFPIIQILNTMQYTVFNDRLEHQF